jgi:hypothetical protein
MADEIKQDRRRFLGGAATSIAPARAGMAPSADAHSGQVEAADKSGARPFDMKLEVVVRGASDVDADAGTGGRRPCRTERETHLPLARPLQGC